MFVYIVYDYSSKNYTLYETFNDAMKYTEELNVWCIYREYIEVDDNNIIRMSCRARL